MSSTCNIFVHIAKCVNHQRSKIVNFICFGITREHSQCLTVCSEYSVYDKILHYF